MNTPTLSNAVLRLGGFHTLCTLLVVIGKRFADAGLRDLLVETGVFSDGSVSSVLDGKQYYRAIRAHKIVVEALQCHLWQEFESWIDSVETGYGHVNLVAIKECLNAIRTDCTEGNIYLLLRLASFLALLELYERFI